ncbi:MAG: twin-arginine translocase subunit TatC [Planctomycetes bacterium]|nr:twin-arginine translocase subunit TatC [Planctomycetota bacterium]
MPAFHNPYPDDPFARSRMPLEDHLEELSVRLRRALAGVVLVMVGGMSLDVIGQALDRTEIGFAFPVLRALTAPAEQEVEAFFLRRYEQIAAKLRARPGGPRETFGLGLPAPNGGRAEVLADVDPVELARVTKLGELRGNFRRPLTTLSAPEAMVTYFKVAFVLALVIASPWAFYQMWAFVAAGLYPHEKRYVYALLPASVTLFLAGVALCQLVVLPSAVRALLTFNDWAGYDPDLRLREWIGFAVVMPLIFGVSFQTPVLMAFFTRIGVTTARGYLTYWRHAALGMAAFAAVITPTQDVITWGYLFVPLFTLFLVGVGVCRLVEPGRPAAAPSV